MWRATCLWVRGNLASWSVCSLPGEKCKDHDIIIFILHMGRIYSSTPFVLLIKYQSQSSCHSPNCSYLTHIGLQISQKWLIFSAGISGKWDCLGYPEDAGLASPSNLEGFICSLPVPAATRSGFMNDFKHLSGDSNRTRIQHCHSFSVLLEDIYDKKR